MPNASLYELLGISRERADEVAKRVRESFRQSKTPAEWIKRLAEEFHVDEKNAEVFACGWFAGKYAGVSEVFNNVQKEMDKRETELAVMRERENRYPEPDGYV
jgi:hypothetical protein